MSFVYVKRRKKFTKTIALRYIRSMKKLLRVFGVLIALLLIGALALQFTGNGHVLRGLRSTYLAGKSRPDIDDQRFHAVRTVEAGVASPWNEALLASEALPQDDLRFLSDLQTAAFVVVHGDQLIYEYYGEGFDRSAHLNSFSMAKSFTSMAVGAAVDRGLIATGEPVGTYLPRFNEGLNKKLLVEHLLQMRSNIDFGESYADPFGYQAKAYFGDDLWALTAPYRVDGEPGTEWKYEGGNTVLLSELLTSATDRLLSEAFSRDIWQRVGAEQGAYWNIDREDGHEKAFSAFYATARDFARIGRLMLNNGRWGDQQVLSEAWVQASIAPVNTPDPEGKTVTHYGYQWWLAPPHVSPWHFSARGMRGQYIICVPEHDLVVVRMGRKRIEELTEDECSPDLPKWIAMGINLAEQHAKRH